VIEAKDAEIGRLGSLMETFHVQVEKLRDEVEAAAAESAEHLFRLGERAGQPRRSLSGASLAGGTVGMTAPTIAVRARPCVI
jgi:hypothetical protein